MNSKMKKVIVIAVIVLLIAGLAAGGFALLKHMTGAKIVPDSVVISMSASENGTPENILAQRPNEKSEDTNTDLPVLSQEQGKIVVSARKSALIDLPEATGRLFRECTAEECGYTSEHPVCNNKNYGDKLMVEALPLSEGQYYNFHIDLSDLEPGHYRVEFLDDGDIENTSIEFILE